MATLAAAILLAASVTDARLVSLLRSPGPREPYLYVAPVKHTGALLGPVGGQLRNASGTAGADWYVAQWNNWSPFTDANLPAPGSMPATPPSPSCNASADAFGGAPRLRPVWSVETSAARVCALEADHAAQQTTYVQLAADGGKSLQCGKEFDMFLSPMDNAYRRYTPSNINPGADGWSLSPDHVASLNVSVDVSLDYLAVRSRCGTAPQCGPTPDYGYMTIGTPLHNNVSREQLFFQTGLFDSRNGACGGDGDDMCDASRPMTWYFRKLPVLGSNVAAAAVPGGACLRKAGDAVKLRMAMLPTLREAVRQAHEQFGADGDLRKWFFNGFYVGLGLQGDVTMTATVGNVAVTADVLTAE